MCRYTWRMNMEYRMDFQFYQYGFNFNPKTVKSREIIEHKEKEEANFQLTMDALYTESKSKMTNKKTWLS